MPTSFRETLDQARSHLPGYVYAQLVAAAKRELVTPEKPSAGGPDIREAQTLEAMWEWGQQHLPLCVGPQDGVGNLRKVHSAQGLLAAARWAFDRDARGLVAKRADGKLCGVDKKDAYRSLTHVVPSTGPQRAQVAFVAMAPTPTDAARGEPLTGAHGALFAKAYLEPLGLKKQDVFLTHLLPTCAEPTPTEVQGWLAFAKRELEAAKPMVVVALGQPAKEALGSRANFVLPHPAALHKRHDSGELARKLRQVRERLTSLKKDALRVRVASVAGRLRKADAAKQIVYGVPLDPYQFDTQGDWVPPWEVEDTAHDWAENSRVIGFMHEQQADATMLENFLWPYPSDDDYRAAMANEPHAAFTTQYGNQQVHSGCWILGVRIDDPAVWQMVLDGEIAAYSIGGVGVRTPIDPALALPKVRFIDQGAAAAASLAATPTDSAIGSSSP